MALERQGIEVIRLALNGWDDHLADSDDIAERSKTHFVLRNGLVGLSIAIFKAFLRSPGHFFNALGLALKMSRGADRSLPYHLAYLAEAADVVDHLRKHKAQHLHAHFATNSTEVAMLAQALGGPAYSFTVHGTAEFDKIKQLGIAEKVRRSAFVVSICSHGRSQLYRFMNHALWHKIKLIHCGLESTFYKVPAVPLPEKPRLVCVGRLSAEKGQLLLVQAVGALAREGVRVELVLAGDGELRPALEKMMSEFGITDQVVITGWISSDEVRRQIQSATALVLPSFSEGLPVVIMEAMALRRPVLATYVGGIAELVENQQTGWLFPAGDVVALATAMKDCLNMAPDRLKQMGDVAYERVVAQHSVDTEAAKLAELFRQVVDKKEMTV